MHPITNIAIKAARTAGNLVMRATETMDRIEVIEKQKNDLVTSVDRQAEETIIEIIHEAYPSHAILAEESGQQAGQEYTWIIDPIDGTKNFVHGYPHYSISIAVQKDDKIEHGVVYDPVRQELFTATRGRGANLNNRRIRVSRQPGLDNTLLGTGFPFKNPEMFSTYMKTFEAIFPKCAGVRRAGSAALDLAYVAAGRLDGFWEFGLNRWDIAAGVLLIKEAGGLVGDMNGGETYLDKGDVIAANPKLFKAMLQTINAAI